MQTFPNPKVIHIQKKTYKKESLQVGIEEWQKAARILTPSTFKLYLYLAGNKDGFDLALSLEAVREKLNIQKTAFHNAVNELIKVQYLQKIKGNVYRFTTDIPENKDTIPENQTDDIELRKSEQNDTEKRIEPAAKADDKVHKNGTEINNINITNNKIDNRLSDNLKKKMEEIVDIDVGENTVDAILNITGNEPDEDIILEIIEHYARMFAECDKGSGYRFVMLTNKIREHYEQYADNKRKRTIARQVEDCWRKKEKEEEINFELITSPSPKSSKKSHRMQFLYEEFLKTDNKAPLTAESSIDDYDIETSKMFKTLEQLTGKPIVPYDESNDLYPEWQ